MKAMIEQFCCNLVFRAFQTPGHQLYQSSLMEQLNAAGIQPKTAITTGGDFTPLMKKPKVEGTGQTSQKAPSGANLGGDSAGEKAREALKERLKALGTLDE